MNLVDRRLQKEEQHLWKKEKALSYLMVALHQVSQGHSAKRRR